MKFCTISDLHIKRAGDEPSKLLEKFVTSNQVKESDIVFFLGDIFDFMVGNRLQYLNKFQYFFHSVLTLVSQGKKVIYIEGNHDFHLEKIMKIFKEKNKLSDSQFIHSKVSIMETYDDKKFFFSHGHEIDENKSYQKWKNVYSSKPFKLLVDYIIPFSFIENMGDKASKNSKKRGVKSFIYEKSQNMYRHGAKVLIESNNLDFLVTGHTHIMENIEISSATYVNNGFPQHTKKFIYFDGKTTSLISFS